MRDVGDLITRLFGSWQLVLVILFSIFSASAVGIYNTLDAPQLYTGESLIRYADVDLSHFNEPHNYTAPDVYYRNNQILGVRGYLLSGLSIPIHLISRLFLTVAKTGGFTDEIAGAKGFKLELVITTFFTIYAALGVTIWYLITKLVTKDKITSWLMILTVGLGSYIWKYSSAYIRQNMIIFLLGLAGWCLIKIIKTNKSSWVIGLLVVWSISFGIDMILFIALGITFIILIVHQRVGELGGPIITKGQRKWLVAPLIVLSVSMFFNYHWYGSLLASQTDKQPTVRELVGDRAPQVWLSTPIYPTIITVLFNFGKIDKRAFGNIDELPRGVAIFTSADYAKKYNFFGVFTVTPILLFSIVGLFSKKVNGLLKTFSVSMFSLGILGNLKVLNFWGGNQYDVRYFYPYIVVLIPLAAEGVAIIRRIKTWWWRYLGLVTIGLTGGWSILMGWIGELNMFLPSMSGERKVWDDIFSFEKIVTDNSIQRLFGLTFMNRDNWWWATLTVVMILILIKLTSGWLTTSWQRLVSLDGRKQ